MIIFQPTYTFKKIASVDFDALGSVFNQLFIEVTGYERNRVIKLGVTKTNSYAYINEGKITIAKQACQDTKLLFEHLIHEFRHWIQHIHFKVKFGADSSDFAKYYNSPHEKDARKFEKLTDAAFKLYENLISIKQLIKTNELWYYNEQEENV